MSAALSVASAMKRSTHGMAASTEPETGGEASAIRNVVAIVRLCRTIGGMQPGTIIVARCAARLRRLHDSRRQPSPLSKKRSLVP